MYTCHIFLIIIAEMMLATFWGQVIAYFKYITINIFREIRVIIRAFSKIVKSLFIIYVLIFFPYGMIAPIDLFLGLLFSLLEQSLVLGYIFILLYFFSLQLTKFCFWLLIFGICLRFSKLLSPILLLGDGVGFYCLFVQSMFKGASFKFISLFIK